MRPTPRTLDPELTAGELKFLIGLLQSHPFRGKHLEIGTAAGGTLCRMMQAYSPQDRPPFVVVDPMTYFHDQIQVVRDNLRKHDLSPGGVDFRVMKSGEAFERAAQNGETFDFIFVDGAHKIHYVTEDLRWTRLLRTGGIVCFHDYASVKGVRMAVDRFMMHYLNYETIGCADTLLALRKTGESPSPEVTLCDRLWASVWAPLLRLERYLEKAKSRLG